MRPAGARKLDGIVRYEVAVDDRGEGQRARGPHRHLVEQRFEAARTARDRRVGQPVDVVGADAERGEELLGHPPRPGCAS